MTLGTKRLLISVVVTGLILLTFYLLAGQKGINPEEGETFIPQIPEISDEEDSGKIILLTR